MFLIPCFQRGTFLGRSLSDQHSNRQICWLTFAADFKPRFSAIHFCRAQVKGTGAQTAEWASPCAVFLVTDSIHIHGTK